MPRVIRDSDEETTAESKSSTRRTRATASSSTTDSPARRTTRRNKQLAIIESSPESLDDSSPQPAVRKTRSRAATLDKSSAGVAKNLRSRKNSASSNLSETIDLDADQQQQTTQKRVTRKAAAVAAAIGTPTKTSLRSRNLRAGSEAKSTPPATSSRSTRVTRASSVDPINTPNESVVGTPVKRRTRASIVPIQQTVAEEQEDKNEISETVNNIVVEIDEDSENEAVSTKGKSNKKVAKKSSSSSNKEKAGKDTSTEQSNLETSELTIEGNMTDKSCTSNGVVEVEETSEKSALEALGSHSTTFKQESFISREQGGENSQSIEPVVLSADQNSIKSDYPNKNEHVQNNSSVDMIDEYEHVDVENFTLTDESIDVVNSPKKTDVRDTLALDIKDSYVKLDRTRLVEKMFGGKQPQLEENKSNDLFVKIADVDRGGETSQNDVIANAKTAIVLVNDFVKSNEYFNSMKDEKNFDSGISLNNKGGEDVNSNASVHKSDDDQSIVAIEDDDDDDEEVLSLKLSSPNSHAMRVGEADGDKLIIEALPDDEMSNEDKSIATSVNSSSIHNVEKANFYLKDNDNGAEVVLPEGKSNLKKVVNENNIEMACIDDEIGDESGLVSENVGKTDASKMMNASVGTHSLHESLQQNDSIEDRPIISSDVKPPSIVVDLDEEEAAAEAKVDVGSGGNVEINQNDSIEDRPIISSDVKSPSIVVDLDEEEAAAKAKVDIGFGGNVEINESAVASNGAEAEKLGVTDSSESMDTSSSAMPESTLKDNLEISNSRNATTNSNEIESKLKDNTGVPCAVTDADGENASRPPKDDGDDDEAAQHETSADTTPAKSPAKKGGSKRKSQTQVTDSDLDESAENLFQDIPAEEWSAAEQRKSAEAKNDLSTDTFDGSVVAEQEINSQANNKRKSLNGKERGGGGDRSMVGACETENQQADSSPTKARKSLERKRDSGGASSDSGIQNGNKVAVESDSSDDDDDNELLNKSRSRRSLNGSLKAQSKNDSISENLSKSLLADVSKSSNKSRKSLNNSTQFNVSVFNTFRKKNDSISEVASNAERNDSVDDAERRDENSEATEVDEGSGGESSPAETSKAKDSQSRRKSRNKSLVGQSHDDDNIGDKLTVSLNSSSQAAKRSSLDKPLNRSRRKSLAAHGEQVADSNKERITDEESQSKNDGLSVDVSLNESKKSRKRLSEKINVSAYELPAESEEMEVDVVTAASGDDKSPGESRKSKSLVNSSKLSLDQEAPPKSGRKSANTSLNVSAAGDVVTKSCEEVGKVKVTTKSPIKPSLNESAAAEDAEEEEEEEKEEEQQQQQEAVPTALDRSLQKSIERMKFSNPPKHDVSTVVQVNSSSAEDDSDDSQIPNFIFKLSDEEEETEDSSEENAENDVDSDVEREYNLAGRDIAKYSDDDVLGDDCRVSEEESSDHEDDGADLEDFVVPDGEGDDDDDEEEDEEEEEEDAEGEDENEDKDEDEDNSDEDGDEDLKEKDEGIGIEGPSAKKISELKKNVSVNSSQSTVKNSSVQLRRSGFSQSSGSESDDEATEVENKTSNEHFDCVADSEKLLKDSKKLERQSIVLSNMIKAQNSSLQRRSLADKSLKSTKSNVSFSSSMTEKEKSLNVSAKNKSSNTSKCGREDKNSSKSKDDEDIAAHNGSGKNKSVLLVENGHAESSSSDSDDYEEEATSEASEGESVASSSSGESSEEEEGEDYYRVVESTKDASLVKPKSKKLIDCSTPKPGAKKPADMSKDNLSISAAAASRRKSGSLNDLSSTKMMSSRLSVGEAAASKSMKLGDTSMKLKDDVEIVATPETLARPRQAWKLIPLNQTAHPAVEDTPGTKFLKKAKLNESFPADLESMKSGNPSSSAKKSKKAAPKQEPPSEKESSKKRKLLDLSHVHDEDSILKVAKKNKKRARLNESLASAGNAEEGREAADVEQSGNEQQRENEPGQAQKSKKKKRNRAKEGRGEEEAAEAEAPEETEERPSKKRKDKRAQAAADEEEAQSAETPKKKRSKGSTAESSSVSEQKSTKKRRKQADPDDEAPESVGFEAARRVALREMQQQAEGARTAKEALKKKRKDAAQPTSKSLKRLPEDVVESLTDEPLCQRPDKRQKLSRNRERSVMMPSKSMFSPGKSTPENLRVDDGYVPLSSAGGTTQFAVVNLHKARKVAKKSAAVLNFRSKMLARNKRMPTSTYLDYLKRQKAKGNL